MAAFTTSPFSLGLTGGIAKLGSITGHSLRAIGLAGKPLSRAGSALSSKFLRF